MKFTWKPKRFFLSYAYFQFLFIFKNFDENVF